MLADKSEPFTEPGTIIPSEFGKHLFSNLSISAFHMDNAWKTKLYFTVSILAFGRIKCIFEDLALITKSSLIKIGVLDFKTLKTTQGKSGRCKDGASSVVFCH